MAGPGGYTTMGLLGAAATAPLLWIVARLPRVRPAAA
jgi:hypothetical protein